MNRRKTDSQGTEDRQPLVDWAAERHTSYAVAHRLALTGQIPAVKQGGRWFVEAVPSQ